MKRRRRQSVPKGCDPAVTALFAEMNEQMLNVADIAERAGIHPSTIWNWKCSGISPTVPNLRAVLNAVGYDIKVVRKP